ncbi:MAG: ABC transporter ATP-binding protein [Bdellovibrionales bacterium]
MLSARMISKSYEQGGRELKILKGLSLELGEGDDVCILGPSGAGKSTFLHILGTLDRPSGGQLLFRGEELIGKSDEALAQFRNRNLGFVFQFHYLLSEFTALENVMMPGRIGGMDARECRQKAEKLLGQLGLTSRAQHYPSEMSGGEQQRVAIARALICGPTMLLADEPTGNLDTQNAKLIQDLFFDLKRDLKLAVVAVTHDTVFASRFSRQLRMADGLWASNF